jgi:hypothetical protein
MKTRKRTIIGSFLALSVFAVPAAALAEEMQSVSTPVLVYCISCGSHHLIDLAAIDN